MANKVGLTVTEAAKEAGVSPETIRAWVRSGRLTNYGGDGKFVVSRIELHRIMGGQDLSVETLRKVLEPVIREAVREELRAAFARVADRR